MIDTLIKNSHVAVYVMFLHKLSFPLRCNALSRLSIFASRDRLVVDYVYVSIQVVESSRIYFDPFEGKLNDDNRLELSKYNWYNNRSAMSSLSMIV